MNSENEFNPLQEEIRLKKLLEIAKKQRNKNSQGELNKKLVKLYVSQGEYFKMAEKPEPSIAKKYLEKAICLQKDHPVANYRLAYIYYQEKNYTRAAYYFENALDGSIDEELNDTQRMLANMFLVNCGIKIAKEAIIEVNFIEDNIHLDLENERIERYKKEILVLDEEIFDKMFYRKIENGKDELIGEYEYIHYEPAKNQVILKSTDQGMEIQFENYQSVPLNPKSFYTLIGILTAKDFKIYNDLREIVTNGSGQEISDDNIRQIISRLSRNIPYWNIIFDTKSIPNPNSGRNIMGIKLMNEFSLSILCRVEDYLPD